jgi:hypothetical protein
MTVRAADACARHPPAALMLCAAPTSAVNNRKSCSKNELTDEVVCKPAVPEGLAPKDIAKRLRIAYNSLPQRVVKCGPGVRSDVKCTSPGADAEAAYAVMIDVVKKASAISPAQVYAF